MFGRSFPGDIVSVIAFYSGSQNWTTCYVKVDARLDYGPRKERRHNGGQMTTTLIGVQAKIALLALRGDKMLA